MSPVNHTPDPPYAAGAGTIPPHLAGRDDVISEFSQMLGMQERGLHTNPRALIGHRGLGKTVLLSELETIAREKGWKSASFEVSTTTRLSHQLLDAVNELVREIAPTRSALQSIAKRLDRATKTIKIETTKLAPLSFGFELTDDGDADQIGADLRMLFEVAGELARDKNTGAAIFIDELHEAPIDQLRSLGVALQSITKRRDRLPLQIVAAGLPHLDVKSMKARTYGERMWEVWDVLPLDRQAVADALRTPARGLGREYDDDAIDAIYAETQGYPYFVQRWGVDVWKIAPNSLITEADVSRATPMIHRFLDLNFYRLRRARLTPAEEAYVEAMGSLAPENRTTSRIAALLGKQHTREVSPTRQSLIDKGVIEAPAHGLVAFTVPGFGEHLHRDSTRHRGLGFR